MTQVKHYSFMCKGHGAVEVRIVKWKYATNSSELFRSVNQLEKFDVKLISMEIIDTLNLT